MHEPRHSLLHRVGQAASDIGRGGGHPRRRYALELGVGALVFGALVFTVASQWSELQRQNVELDLVWVAPALLVLVVLHVVAAFGWDLILRALGHWLRPARAQMAWAQSLLARYVPGGVLMVLGRLLLTEREGVPRRTTMASMVYEQGLMVVAALLVGSWALVGEEIAGRAGWVIVVAGLPLLVAAMHPRIFGPLANAALGALGRPKLPALLPFRTVLWLIAFFLVVWGIFGVGAFLAARTVIDLPLSDLPAVTAAQALGYSAAVVTVVFPGGLGIRDGAFALVLDATLPGGFALAAAIAIAVRLITTLAEIAYAGAATLLGRRAGVTQPLREAT